MCISIEIVCPSDCRPECRRLYERVRELVDVVALATASCIEVKELPLPAPREWFEIRLPIILVREGSRVQIIEASAETVVIEEPSVGIYSVISTVIDKNAALQVLRAEAVSL